MHRHGARKLTAMDPFNLFEAVLPEEPDESRPDGFRRRHLQIGRLIGGSRIGATLYELPPVQRICPYHCAPLALHSGSRTPQLGPRAACWITLNGAVEELIRRNGRAIRVRLAGPGIAFGYVGLIDGEPSSVTAPTRERSRLLRLRPTTSPRSSTGRPSAQTPSATLHAELMATHHAIERPQAQLATGR